MEKIIEFVQALLVLLLMLFGGGETDTPPPVSHTPSDTVLELHFIDVGQADATLLVCGGETMLIDGGNAEDSSLIYTYLSDRGIDHLNYVAATHAHEDHVGGLSGALHYATVDTVFSPVTDYDSKAFRNFVQCVTEQGKAITVPKAGDSFPLGEARVQILHCDPSNDNPNNTGLVFRITFGDTSFLIMGDAELDVESEIMDAGYDVSADLLRVGHHGSNTSTGYRLLYEAWPAYAVISVGANNSYGHPHEEVMSRLEDAELNVYRTDLHGDILCVTDGSTITITTQR